MKTSSTVVFAIVVSLAAFLTSQFIWPYPRLDLGDLKTFFMLVSIMESALFGIGVAFVVYVIANHRRFLARWSALRWATFAGIAWTLVSGVPHDGMHLTHGAEFHGLVPIEILFHGSLAVAVLVIMIYFVRNLNAHE